MDHEVEPDTLVIDELEREVIETGADVHEGITDAQVESEDVDEDADCKLNSSVNE